MKKLILLELALLFLATTFQSHNPPGWYQQTLPVNDFVNDVFFLDSLNGWTVTQGRTNSNDTGYIFRTYNGGSNWTIQFSKPVDLKVVFMVDTLTGYVGGGSGSGTRYMYKTINGGISWDTILGSFASGGKVLDISFVNYDTGWYCDDDLFDGGLYKTTNGGISWVRQLDETFRPTKLFFLNKDTGWAACNSTKLYRTINGGINWDLQFNSEFHIESIFFLNPFNGWIRGGYISNTMGIAYSTDGGYSWINSQGDIGGFDIMFVNDSIGYSGSGPNKITKSVNGGKNWGKQMSPITNCLSISILKNDSTLGWGGGTGIVHTNDGGGTIVDIKQINNIIPDNFILNQNYPNPFNPKTIINYELGITNHVALKVYDINGKIITNLVNKKQDPGNYKIEFDGSGLSSGVYFYSLYIENQLIDTKKMVLIR